MWEDVYGAYDEDIKKEHYGEDGYKIINILEKISNNRKHNKKLITKYFDINYKNDCGQSLLHLFVDNLYDEEKVLLVVELLLDLGLSPNLKDNVKYNFIQTALYTGYSEDFILKIINLSQCSEHYVFDPNHKDEDGDTMMHTAIYSEEYKGNLFAIYDALLRGGLDHKIKNKKGRDILDALTIKDEDNPDKIIPDKDYMIEILSIDKLKSNINYVGWSSKYKNLSQKDREWLNQYGYFDKVDIVVKHKWLTINNEKKLRDKSNIFYGKDGVGKSTYLKMLMNDLSKNDLSVYYTSFDQIILNCNGIGNFYNIFYNIMKKCVDNELILLFDDFDKVFRNNMDKDEKELIEDIIRMYVKEGLKIIATVKEENKEFIENGILNKELNFNYIDEPTISTINKYIDNELNTLNISIDSNIDTILKELITYITNKDNLEEEYKNISNIKIVSNLLNDIVSFNNDQIDINNIIYGINMCSYLKLDSKKYILEELNNYKKNIKPLIKKRNK